MIEPVLAFVFGLLIGSFLNVCIYRLPRDLSVVRPRSFCPGCEKTIAWHDNIPLLSFVRLRGRCRSCGAQIPWRYPVVELLTACLFAAALLRFGATPAAWKACVFCAMQVALIFSDLEERILPDEFTLGGTLVGFLFALAFPPEGGILRLLLPESFGARGGALFESVFAAVFVSGAMWLIGAAYRGVRKREGLGLGDVKMVAMIGAFLGVQGALLALVAGSVAGSLIGLAYIWLAKKEAASYELPFGSFLGAAAIMVSFLAPRPL
jgi:leader peptidase (prepilin peptidase)/N-methyltransferase